MEKSKVFIIIISLFLTLGVFSPLLAAEEDKEEDLILPDITIYGEGEKKDKELLDPGPGVSTHTLDQEEILRPAGSLEDLHRVIQTLPGVVKQGDFTSIMYIRGGNVQETMTFLDDILIINPYHMGIFSIFNNDLVESVDFYAGGFPAIYPNALSGVVDVHYREGKRDGVSGMADLSVISAKARLEGPYLGGKGSYLLSARRTYYDLILAGLEKAGSIDTDETAVPSFSDLYGKFVLDITPRNKLTLSLLRYDDRVTINEFEDPMRPDADPLEIEYKDVNNIVSLWYDSGITPWLDINTGFSYAYMEYEGSVAGTNPMKGKFNADNLTIMTGASIKPSSHHEIQTGVQMYRTKIRMDLFIPLIIKNLDPLGHYIGPINSKKVLVSLKEKLSYVGFYLQEVWDIIPDKFTAQLGVRSDYWADIRQWTYSPRMNISYNLTPDTVIKTSCGLYHQVPANVLFSDEEFGNPDLEGEQSIHYILGIEHLLNTNHLIRLEGYYKDLNNLVVNYDDLASMPPGGPFFTNDGKGYSWGLELFLQKLDVGKWGGWLSYGFAYTKRYNPLHTLDPEWFYPLQDQRHTLSLVLKYRPGQLWNFSAKFKFSSGKPYTPVDESFWWLEEDRRDPNDPDPPDVWMADNEDINSARFPPYHSLGVKAERKFIKQNWDLSLYFEILNAYYHKNIFTYVYRGGDVEAGIYPEREAIYDLPIIPYFGIKAEF